MEQVKTFKNPLTDAEEKRIDYLMKKKMENERENQVITKELRQLIYKVEKGRV